MYLLNLGILLIIGAATWWLTGLDNTAGGESKRGRHLTRALRCIAVVFLSLAFISVIESGLSYGDVPLLILIPVCIALVLRSSLSELFTHGLLHLVDPQLYDDREFDPKKTQRYQDTIAHLIHTGQREEAIKLCEQLKQTGELDATTVENTLEFLGVKQERAQPVRPLVDAGRLRAQGKFGEAEQLLQSLLAKNPADDGAAIMLMRLYAQDLRQPDRAYEVLRALEKQPHVPAAHLEFARRSIDEWRQPQAAQPDRAQPRKAKSVDELLAQGSYGVAVEMLEEQIKTQPENFELQLKLAEVYAVHCKILPRAERIVGHMERTPSFSPRQIAAARAKLAEWHASTT